MGKGRLYRTQHCQGIYQTLHCQGKRETRPNTTLSGEKGDYTEHYTVRGYTKHYTVRGKGRLDQTLRFYGKRETILNTTLSRQGKREIICLWLHWHHQNDSCIKMGSDESHFNVSLIVRDKVTRWHPQTTTFEGIQREGNHISGY